MIIKITKDSKFCNEPLLSYLKSLSLSGKMIKFLKYNDNGIMVNGQKVTVRYILRENDILELQFNDIQSSDSAFPTNIPIDIVFENDDFMIVNKPPYMPTHPSHGHRYDTLANALAYYFQSKNIPFVFRPINRLDRNTSGLVIIAKNKISAANLSNLIKEKKVIKSYIAFLEGELEDPTETIEYYSMSLGIINRCIRRAEKSIIFRETCDNNAENAEQAITLYRILRKNKSCTEVEAFPLTGRTHQLRVHFSSLGHPIIGDDLYGSKSSLIARQALHAKSLTINFDNDNISRVFTSNLPEDISCIETAYFSDVQN